MVTGRVSGIAPSLTLAITDKANKLKKEGVKIVSFGAGEPDFSTPAYITEAAKAAIDAGHTKYTASSGILPLRAAIADKFKKDNGLSYAPSQIIVSNGAKHSLYNACAALIEKGDEVIVPAPYWLTYPELVRICGGRVKVLRCSEKDGFKPTAEKLKRAITKKTKAVILNSPSNPSGAVYSLRELEEIGAVLEAAGVYVISDEIYEKLVYGGAKHYSVAAVNPKLYNKTVTINGFSKAYAMTGWRVGYAGAPADIAAGMDALQSHTASNANTPAQYAALAALTDKGGAEVLQTMIAAFDARRRTMCGRIKKMPLVSALAPDGAFYILVNARRVMGRSFNGEKITDALKLSELLLEHARVAVIPCEAFGLKDYLRLSYAVSEREINEGADGIEAFLRRVE